MASTEYVPSGVVAIPSRLDSAAATVRSSSRFSVGRLPRSEPSFFAAAAESSSLEMPAASFTISLIGQ